MCLNSLSDIILFMYVVLEHVPYSIACCAWNLKIHSQHQFPIAFSSPVQYSRSLLSGKALVDDLGVAVDAKVLNSRSVRRGRGGIALSSHSSLQSRSGTSRESLHLCRGQLMSGNKARIEWKELVWSWNNFKERVGA